MSILDVDSIAAATSSETGVKPTPADVENAPEPTTAELKEAGAEGGNKTMMMVAIGVVVLIVIIAAVVMMKKKAA